MFARVFGPADPPGCDADGTSTMHFTGRIPIVQGPLTGKYLHITGDVTIGPQTETVNYGYPAQAGPATGLSGAFSIAAPNGSDPVAQGQLVGLAPPTSIGQNIASCYGVGAGNHFGRTNLQSATLQAMQLTAAYTYTDANTPEPTPGRLVLRQQQIGQVGPTGSQGVSTSGPAASFLAPSDPEPQDTTPPTITIGSPGDGSVYTVGQSVTATYSCADDTDPAPSCSGPIASGSQLDTSSPGSKTFTVTTSDSSGNNTSKTHTYEVVAPAANHLEGFSAPVDMDAVNVSKAGQTIPLKFRYVDSTGAPVTNLTSVGVTAKSLSCALGTTMDQVEEYATGGSGLKNLGGGDYQFNWQTPKSYASSCKTVTVTVAPGVSVSADFAFKK